MMTDNIMTDNTTMDNTTTRTYYDTKHTNDERQDDRRGFSQYSWHLSLILSNGDFLKKNFFKLHTGIVGN